MSSVLSRREFLRSSVLVTALNHTGNAAGTGTPPAPRRPVVISSGNGQRAAATALQMIQQGADALDAVIAGVNIVEEDPADMTVGYGGLPNEDGVVELDACCMHGPTHRAGAVAGLRGIKTPSQVARLVMTRTDHVLLVGEGALRFAMAHGFKKEDLLTPEARREWLHWKETRSDKDDWIPPEVPDEDRPQSNRWRNLQFTYGTITCSAVDGSGHLGGVTTTSGLSFKLAGRVGDSPIIGAGLYVHNEVGAAGSTGRGEAVIRTCGAHTVVEQMAQGRAPQEACLNALQRVVDLNREPRLKRRDGRPNFDVKFYALNKQGRYGAAAIWSDAKFAVSDATGNRLEQCAYLYRRPGQGIRD